MDYVVVRTNINLDSALEAAAREVLGTANRTDTIHAALRDVVARQARQRELDLIRAGEFPDLANAEIANDARR